MRAAQGVVQDELLHGWPAAAAALARPRTRVNPIIVRKLPGRAKYGLGPRGDEDASSKAKQASAAPPVERPRQPTAAELFRRIIAEGEAALAAAGGDPALLPPPPPRRLLFPADEAAAAAGPGSGPALTARIVARIAACRDWRRPLAHKLLPKYLAVFDQHAASYFFRHVPTLQPRPSGRPKDADADAREAAAFRLMIHAVCWSVLPKVRGSFGPRAVACTVAGLGAMGIRHVPMLSALESASVAQLGERPQLLAHQLLAVARGFAALGYAPGPEWQAAALAAVDALAPALDPQQIGELLQAMPQLQLQPSPASLSRLCGALRAHFDAALARVGGSVASLSLSLEVPPKDAKGPAGVGAARSHAAADGAGGPQGRPSTAPRGCDLVAALEGLARLGVSSGCLPPPEWLDWALALLVAMMEAERGVGVALLAAEDYATLADAVQGLAAAGAAPLPRGWMDSLCDAALAAWQQRCGPDPDPDRGVAAAGSPAAAAAPKPSTGATAAERGQRAGGQAASALLPPLCQLLQALERMQHRPRAGWVSQVRALGLALLPHMDPTQLQQWARAMALWGPLPSQRGMATAATRSWSAALALRSRALLPRMPQQQLAALPAALAAAGCTAVPVGWAAAYVRQAAACQVRAGAGSQQAQQQPGGAPAVRRDAADTAGPSAAPDWAEACRSLRAIVAPAGAWQLLVEREGPGLSALGWVSATGVG